MKITVAPGAVVRDPVTAQRIGDGASIDAHDPYWARQLADEDIAEQLDPTDTDSDADVESSHSLLPDELADTLLEHEGDDQ